MIEIIDQYDISKYLLPIIIIDDPTKLDFTKNYPNSTNVDLCIREFKLDYLFNSLKKYYYYYNNITVINSSFLNYNNLNKDLDKIINLNKDKNSKIILVTKPNRQLSLFYKSDLIISYKNDEIKIIKDRYGSKQIGII